MVTINNPNRKNYIKQAKNNIFSCHTYIASDTEIYSKPIIMNLPYNGTVQKDRINLKQIDSDTARSLDDLVKYGLANECDKKYTITPIGKEWYTNLMYYLLPKPDQAIVDNSIQAWSNRKEYQTEKDFIFGYSK